VSVFNSVFRVYASGGAGAILQTLEDATYGDLHQADTWNWTIRRYGALTLPAGTYRLALWLGATGGGPVNISGSSGGIWAQPVPTV
jgi:hypothetical protein